MTMRLFGNVRRRDLVNYGKGMAFVSPWLIGFLAWTVYPILASLYYSFTRYDVLNPPRWIGLENFSELFLKDEKFRTVTGNTLYFVLVGVPIGVIVAFLLAFLLNNELKLRPFFRTIFFLPSIVPAVATAMVWLWIYNPRYGLINSILANYGITAVPWLSSPGSSQEFLDHYSCLGARRRNGNLLGGASRCATFAIRCRTGGWGEWLASFLAYYDSDVYTSAPFCPAHQFDQHVPIFHHRLAVDRRRPQPGH